MISYDAEVGVKGLKQIWSSLITRQCENRDEIFERHTAHYLNRCYCDWVKGVNHEN